MITSKKDVHAVSCVLDCRTGFSRTSDFGNNSCWCYCGEDGLDSADDNPKEAAHQLQKAGFAQAETGKNRVTCRGEPRVMSSSLLQHQILNMLVLDVKRCNHSRMLVADDY